MKLSTKTKISVFLSVALFATGVATSVADSTKSKDEDIKKLPQVNEDINKEDIEKVDDNQIINEEDKDSENKNEEKVSSKDMPLDEDVERNYTYVDGLREKMNEKNRDNETLRSELDAKAKEDAEEAKKLAEEEEKKEASKKEEEEKEKEEKRKAEEEKVRKEKEAEAEKESEVKSEDNKDKNEEKDESESRERNSDIKLSDVNYDNLGEYVASIGGIASDDPYELYTLDQDDIKKRSEDEAFPHGIIEPKDKNEAKYDIDFMEEHGALLWNGYKFTTYPEHVLPGEALKIPGRHLEDGFVTDAYGFICVASDVYPKGTVIMSPFGRPMRVYDVFNHNEPEYRIDLYIR